VAQYQFDDTKREFPEQEYLTYYTEYQSSQFPMSVTGYDSVIQVMNISDAKYLSADQVKYPYVTINPENKEVSYFTASGVSVNFTLSIPEKLLNSATFSNVPASDLTFDVQNDSLKLHLVLQSLTLKNPQYIPNTDSNIKTTSYIGGGAGIALVKMKK